MIGPHHSTTAVDPQERTLRRSWRLLSGSFFVLGLLFILRLIVGPTRPIDFVLAGLVVFVGYAVVRHRNAVRLLEVGRRAEAESFARILQGLSRSVSPDAIVDAIVEELGIGTGADHIVVVRRHPDAKALAATLVSSRPGVRNAATSFPLSDLEDPLTDAPAEREPVAIPVEAGGPTDLVATAAAVFAGSADLAIAGLPGRIRPARPARPARPTRPALQGAVLGGAVATRERLRIGIERLSGIPPESDRQPGPPRHAGPQRPEHAPQRIADRIAARTRSVYGLRNTLAVPIQTDAGVIGAIVLSRRLADPWPASARRILAGSAIEASAALARATYHREVETRATTDALTGLPNRRYFDEFCGLLARRRRTGDAVGVLLIDIDHFKAVNDTFGHAAGDGVLRVVASAIVAAVREEDVPARVGGEEFAVLLRNPSGDMAIEVAERVRAAVGRLDLRRFGPPGVTVSVGVAVAHAPDEPIPDLVAAADRALYEAKRTGRDRVVASD